MCPEGCKIGIIGFKYLQFVGIAVVGTVVIVKINLAVGCCNAVKTATGIFVTDVYIKLFFQWYLVFSIEYSDQARRYDYSFWLVFSAYYQKL